jgi:hypothetical protein
MLKAISKFVVSALGGATTPVSGSDETIVSQGGVEKKVSVDNFTSGRAVPLGNNSTVGTSSVFPFITALNGLRVGNDANASTFVALCNQDTGASSKTGLGMYPAGGSWELFSIPDVSTFVPPMIATFGGSEVFRFTSNGSHLPGVDGTPNLGSASKRWNTVYASTGTINTSDARSKTAVAPMTNAEINASKQLAKEIGTYRFLDAIAAKGDAARTHIGMTVQRAIEIMQTNGLDPVAYGFICYDEWDDAFVHHPAQDAHDGLVDEAGNVLIPKQEAKDAWVEQTQHAGSRYGFRPDELLLFIARGLEARISKLEGA